MNKKGKMLCYDITEKFGFSQYAMNKTLDESKDSSSNNKYYYRLYWAATLYVVIEGIYHDSDKKMLDYLTMMISRMRLRR